MTNKPRKIGTQFTTDVITYLRANGFEQAELRNQAGEHDKGDVVGIIDVAIECKGGARAETAGDALVERWLGETETERCNADAQVGILVMKRASYGKANAGKWWAVMPLDTVRHLVSDAFYDTNPYTFPVRMHLAHAVQLLRAAGYGTPEQEVA